MLYAKCTQGYGGDEGAGITKVFGVQWDVERDMLLFDVSEVAHTMENLESTK